MSRDFFVREVADTWPSRCFCGSQTGPIVDTYIDLEQYGRVFACNHCVTRFAQALAWRSPEAALDQEEHIARLRERCRELEEALEGERDNKFVSVAELKRLLAAA